MFNILIECSLCEFYQQLRLDWYTIVVQTVQLPWLIIVAGKVFETINTQHCSQ